MAVASDDGKISPSEAAFHPHRSLLLKVLNGQPANDPDLTTVGLRAGDRLLFCSDGLCGMVDDNRIGALAEHHPSVAEMDCNPVKVLTTGAVIVDARVRVEEPPPPKPLAGLRG